MNIRRPTNKCNELLKLSILLSLLCCSLTTNGEPVVWTDHFGDNETCSWNYSEGLYSIKDGVLETIADHGITRRPNSIVYGKWSLDLYLPDTSAEFELLFIADSVMNGYGLKLKGSDSTPDQTKLTLSLVFDLYENNKILLQETTIGKKFSGWRYLVIERLSDKQISISLDGQSAIEETIPNYQTSEELIILSNKGVAIDNVVGEEIPGIGAVQDGINAKDQRIRAFQIFWSVTLVLFIMLFAKQFKNRYYRNHGTIKASR